MKRILLYFSIFSILLLAACSGKKEEPKREMVFLNDSMYQSSMNTDRAAMETTEPEINEPIAASRPTAYRKPVKQKSQYTLKNNNSNVQNPSTPPPAETTALPAPVANPAPATQPATTQGTSAETASTAGSVPAEKEKVPVKKDGMSKSAQGAIIGGVGGAVAGAVISKKGKGAVIGGIIGAAGGYILGRKKDKADGRVE